MQDSYKPTSTIKMVCFFVVILAVLAAGLVIGVKYDLAIDQALLPLWQQAQADHAAGEFSLWYWWAILAESVGYFPTYAAAMLLGWCLCATAEKARKKYRLSLLIGGAVFCLGGSTIFVYTSLEYMIKRGTLDISPTVGLFVGLALGVVLIVWGLFSPIQKPVLHRWRTMALFAAGMALSQFAIIQIVKSICQRTRFDDMLALGDFSDFSAWTALPGNGGSSFPSGHTGNAGTILILLVACRLFDACRGDEPAFLCLGYGFTGAVAFGRLLIGRHYLSDTLAAMVIVTLLLMIAWFAPPLARLANVAGQSKKPAPAVPVPRPDMAQQMPVEPAKDDFQKQVWRKRK